MCTGLMAMMPVGLFVEVVWWYAVGGIDGCGLVMLVELVWWDAVGGIRG